MTRFMCYQFCAHFSIGIDVDKIANMSFDNRTNNLTTCPNTTKTILPYLEMFTFSISFIVSHEHFPDREVAYTYSDVNAVGINIICELVDDGACLFCHFHLSLKNGWLKNRSPNTSRKNVSQIKNPIILYFLLVNNISFNSVTVSGGFLLCIIAWQLGQTGIRSLAISSV